MEFENLTPFSALAYTAIDVHDQEFRVVAIPVAYRLEPDPARPGQWIPIVIDEDSPPLCMADEHFGEMNASSVRRESDLAPYKPRCDVILNTSAYAPGGKPARSFPVRFTVRRPGAPASLPGAPQPLSPLMPVDASEMVAWKAAVERARQTVMPGQVLLDKALVVTGPRHFKKHATLFRFLQNLSRWCSLGVIQPCPWTLTTPAPITTLPLRYEFAWGGQCRINAWDNSHLGSGNPEQQASLHHSDAFAKRVPKKQRLTPERLAEHPDQSAPPAQQPIAHSVCQHNPIGTGFAEAWYLKATRLNAVAAPQIVSSQAPLTARLFWQAAQAKGNSQEWPDPVGYGCIGRPWLPRRNKAGSYDQAWKETRWPLLPADFDMGYWNCAPQDQQIPYLVGNETIELTNLIAHDAPGASKDARGNTLVSITLPGHRAFVLAYFDEGGLFPMRAVIDTLTLEPEHPDGPRLTCLWRTLAPVALPLVRLEARFEVDPHAPLIRVTTSPSDPAPENETERKAA